MSEPTSAVSGGVVVLAVAIAGPVAGQYIAILFGALAGSLWALGKTKTETRAAGAYLVLRLVLTACVITGPLAWWLGTHYNLPANQLLAPVALGIAAFGDRWGALLDALADIVGQRKSSGGEAK